MHRFYDPANGRWLNRDPIGYAGGTNLYGYCGGGAPVRRDPSGLDTDTFMFNLPLPAKPGFDCGFSFGINLDDNGISVFGQLNGGLGVGVSSGGWQGGYSPGNVTPGPYMGGYANANGAIASIGGTLTRPLGASGEASPSVSFGPGGGLGVAVGGVIGQNSGVVPYGDLGIPRTRQEWAWGWSRFGYQ